MLEPDVLVDVEFYKTNAGGRLGATPERFFGCIFSFEGNNYDGRFLLEKIGSIAPGEIKKSVPVVFLCPENIMPKLRKGAKLMIREGKYIGEAIVSKMNFRGHRGMA